MPSTLGEVVRLPRLRAVRERQLLTQAELAERARVNPKTVIALEAGAEHPRPSTVRKLAAALGVAPSELMAPEPRRRRR
jgi:transcriptional regulator with XRE-family HTH domain